MYKARLENPSHAHTTPMNEEYLPETFRNLDFSGHELLNFWNSNGQSEYTIRADPSKMKRKVASQVVFHSVMGTHKENLCLLEWMTETRFFTR